MYICLFLSEWMFCAHRIHAIAMLLNIMVMSYHQLSIHYLFSLDKQDSDVKK